MRYTIIFMLIFSIVSCGKDDDNEPSKKDQDKTSSELAEGTITQNNKGPQKTYTVDQGYMRAPNDTEYLLTFKFENNDSLKLGLKKFTNDINYHYPKPFSDNQLLFAVWNTDTLILNQGAVSLKKTSTANKYESVINITTLSFGDLNGTVKNFPLLQ